MNLNPGDRSALLACPPIAALDDSDRDAVLAAATVSEVPAKHLIVRQGTSGDSFFILLSGSAEVFRDNNGRELQLVEIGPGDYFGEQALRSATPGRRTASVRTRVPARFVAIPSAVFTRHIEASAENREAFERDAARQLYTDLRHTLELYTNNDKEPLLSGSEQRSYAAGETIVTESSPSDSAYLILQGTAVAVRGQGTAHRELAHLGAGQIFGELGVLKGTVRAATVIAETELTALRIEAEAFKVWHHNHPMLSGIIDTLSDVYALADGRNLNVFLGRYEGAEAVTTVRGDPHDGVVSTRVTGRGLVVFANAAASTMTGDREIVEYVNGDTRRELQIIVTERSTRGIARAVVHGLSAESISSDLGTHYQSVLNLEQVDGVALRRFKRTGFLGGKKKKSDRLCPCLGLSRDELSCAAREVGRNFEALRTNYGVSTLCGGCEPALRAFVEELEDEVPTELAAPPPPDNVELDDDQRWLRNLLAVWDEDKDGYISHDQLRIRLRGLGTKDVDAFIDGLFGNALQQTGRISLDGLATAISASTQGYTGERRRATKTGGLADRVRSLLRPLRTHKRLSQLLGAIFALGVAGLIVRALLSGGSLTVAVIVITLVALAALLRLSSASRFLWGLFSRGLRNYYATLYNVYGRVTERVQMRPLGPIGPTVFVLRDEAMIDRVLHNPDIYPRSVLSGYPGFGKNCVLGAGSGGEWLGYRSLCEEYFVEGYREDLGLINEIASERIATWADKGEIKLLDEIYRIALEIRARVFFQTSFGCFDDGATPDMAALVDRVLTPPVLLVGDDHLGEAKVLQTIVMAAVQGSTRPDSIGGILREALNSGKLTEQEALESASMYVLAQAPTMGIFWVLYRAARDGTQDKLRGDRRAMVQAIKEELRLHPAVPTMLTRVAARDDRVGETFVPKGSVITINPFFVHSNPAQWSEPRQFQSEPWHVPRGDSTDLVDPLADEADGARRPQPRPQDAPAQRYLPFGAGPQSCQARWFATDEMLAVIDSVLKAVDLEVTDDGDLLARPLEDQVTMHVYCRPAREVRIRVRRLQTADDPQTNAS